jgi:hypothetical protein
MSHHDARMAAGEASLAMMDALQDDDVVEALNELGRQAIAVRDLLSAHGVPTHGAVGSVFGVILTAMQAAE